MKRGPVSPTLSMFGVCRYFPISGRLQFYNAELAATGYSHYQSVFLYMPTYKNWGVTPDLFYVSRNFAFWHRVKCTFSVKLLNTGLSYSLCCALLFFFGKKLEKFGKYT